MPSLELAVGGTYAKLVGGGGAQCGGGLRGDVRGFSRQSRKRLLDLLNQVKVESLSRGLFLTLTYPNAWPEDPVTWKRHLDSFCKRVRRKYPGCALVWRLEWKTRLSGSNAGRVAPHYHLIALGLPRISLRWLAEAWYDVVDSGDLRHLGAGTSAQRIRHRRGIMFYASKYLGKVDAEVFGGWTGRVWGVVGRALLAVHLVVVELSWRQFYKMRRVLRGWVAKQGWRLAWQGRGQGLTAYIGDSASGRLLCWALEE